VSTVPVARGETGRARSVVQVTLWDSPYLGNFMSGQLLLAEAVANELGLATHLVLAEGALSQPWRSELDRPHLSWSVLPAGGRRRWIRHLEQIVREHRAAIVHSHFTHADLEALVAARRHGASCVWQMHTGFETYSVRQRLKDLVKVGLIGRRVDRVVAVSEWVATLARRRGFRASRVVLIPNAIVLNRFATLPDKASARARFGIDATADVALALAWWPEAKGTGTVLAALQQLAERGDGTVGLLVGEERLERFVRETAPPGVPWVRLTRFVEDAATLYAAADVFVSASRHEGYSYAVGEALACGLPVVLSDIDGTRFFTRAPAAFTFPVDDANALAAQLSRVLANPDRTGLGSANRAWAFERLAIGPWTDRMIVLYRELL
jgi:glycosyltransferase involved in cell wall biosynthesis